MTRLRLARAIALVGAALLFMSWPSVGTPVSPQPQPATATTETISAIHFTDGWCEATQGTTAFDLIAAAPVRVTAAIKAKVRFVQLRYIAGATSTRGCHMLNGTLQATACDALDDDAAGVMVDGNVTVYAVARDLTDGVAPTLSVSANAGTDGAWCATIGF